MKKVLFGLLGLSIMSMGAIDLETKGDNIFYNEKEGQVKITGTVKSSELPDVKYVIYTSSDGGITMGENLNLPDFVLKKNTETTGFKEIPIEKVYVKRVIGGQKVDLAVTDKVSFKLTLDPSYTALSDNNTWKKKGESSIVSVTSLLTKATLEGVVKVAETIAGANLTINDYGNIVANGSQVFRPGQALAFEHTENGVLMVKEKALNNGDSLGDTITDGSNIDRILLGFASGATISNAKIGVKIN
ncbi:MAG: hypothetical protein ACRC6K_00310 [Fusobacteriaceae bacterium]